MVKQEKLVETYFLDVNNIKVKVNILTKIDQAVPHYEINVKEITDSTKLILKKIREEFVEKLDLEDMNRDRAQHDTNAKARFTRSIRKLIDKYFPSADEDTKKSLVNYLLQENLGLGRLEILLSDSHLEELVVNGAHEPVMVYHKKYGWCETNVVINSESRVRHYATMIGRQVNKEITTLAPLMDARLLNGDRVNATLSPISSDGNTITIRKFPEDPWTITKFLKVGTISLTGAALIWLCLQNELSILVAGGTGSGKTSMLNVVSNFFPPNQRIISIEDTRELQLAKNLHWVPMETRVANPEGKGGVSMLDLLVNSLRMRPDRIVVGEIRREKEAQVLVEAMLTGHSCYATIHANNADETITRLTNPPIDIPKRMVSAVSVILVQNRNRRTGKRRTLQIAEVSEEGDAHVLLQLDPKQDVLKKVNNSTRILEVIELYTGMTPQEIEEDIRKKEILLRWMVDNDIDEIDLIGNVMSRYYTDRIDFRSL